MKHKFIVPSCMLIGLSLLSCNKVPDTVAGPVAVSTSLLKTADQLGPDMTELTVLVDWNTDGRDRMLSYSPDEIPQNPNAQCLGQKAYIAYQSFSSANVPLYRLFYNYAPLLDHMASHDTSAEAHPFVFEGVQGYMWNASGALSGLNALRRTWNQAPQSYDQDVAFADETLPPGYSFVAGTLGYAFKRYGLQHEVLSTISNGTISIDFNKVGGGQLWQVRVGSKSLINNQDFGRGIQIDMNLSHQLSLTPTEGGDMHSHPEPAQRVYWQHGSPCVVFNNGGTSFSTTTYPLFWQPESVYHYFDLNHVLGHPVMWNGTYSKTVQLSPFGPEHPQIIKWTATVHFPQNYDYADIGIASAFLTQEFSRFWTFVVNKDGTDITTEYQVPRQPVGSYASTVWASYESLHSFLRIMNGGVVLSNNDGSYALGIYQKNVALPNGADGYAFYRFTGDGGGGTTGDEANGIAFAIHGADHTFSGDQTFVLYIVAGSKLQCISEMQYLKTRLLTSPL
jgi:hypothetical protein